MRAIICDIDGTIANLNHRLHHLERKDWPASSWVDSPSGTRPSWP